MNSRTVQAVYGNIYKKNCPKNFFSCLYPYRMDRWKAFNVNEKFEGKMLKAFCCIIDVQINTEQGEV